uniref:DsbC domain-containing protein n=1 Tax=Caenorhabditis tropicalis TaxID=1561998 RepID=A0A1I7U3S6_9PELO
MKTILLLLSLTSLSLAFGGLGIALPAGEKDFHLPIRTDKDVKAFTREFANGKKETWSLTGPNKGGWVDEKGKKVDSSNFVFKAPDSLTIKKLSKADSAYYDYVSIHEPVNPGTLPPGVHIDPGMPSGIDLTVN